MANDRISSFGPICQNSIMTAYNRSAQLMTPMLKLYGIFDHGQAQLAHKSSCFFPLQDIWSLRDAELCFARGYCFGSVADMV